MTGAPTVGQELVRLLEAYGVDVVFGIPGVHTTELYRGLAASRIRHVTPRHELDAGFMADGYARASGKPGVCLLITGPGITNAITAMAQARADSIPMLVISGVNAVATHGLYKGYLHELPDQSATLRTIALSSERLLRADDIAEVLGRAFAALRAGRPGPVHIEIPTDVMEAPVLQRGDPTPPALPVPPDADTVDAAVALCRAARAPLILAGGGAVWADEELRRLAERLDAPVVTTTNARGLLAGHALLVPASPSLPAVRGLIAASDLVVAVGTQFGPTDYDAYGDGSFVPPANLVRVDVDLRAANTSFPATVTLRADAALATGELAGRMAAHVPPPDGSSGAARADFARHAAFAQLSPKMQAMIEVLATIRDAVPGCAIIGDSTQLAYGGNLYWDAAAPRTWFNAATGYGALGYGPPAAVGAGIALGAAPIVCVVGDGGFQFCLGTLGTAVEERIPIVFLVWNNHGYQEIQDYMISRGVEPVGVRPCAPDFCRIAEAYSVPSERIRLTESRDQAALAPGKLDLAVLAAALERARAVHGPTLIEVITP